MTTTTKPHHYTEDREIIPAAGSPSQPVSGRIVGPYRKDDGQWYEKREDGTEHPFGGGTRVKVYGPSATLAGLAASLLIAEDGDLVHLSSDDAPFTKGIYQVITAGGIKTIGNAPWLGTAGLADQTPPTSLLTDTTFINAFGTHTDAAGTNASLAGGGILGAATTLESLAGGPSSVIYAQPFAVTDYTVVLSQSDWVGGTRFRIAVQASGADGTDSDIVTFELGGNVDTAALPDIASGFKTNGSTKIEVVSSAVEGINVVIKVRATTNNLKTTRQVRFGSLETLTGPQSKFVFIAGATEVVLTSARDLPITDSTINSTAWSNSPLGIGDLTNPLLTGGYLMLEASSSFHHFWSRYDLPLRENKETHGAIINSTAWKTRVRPLSSALGTLQVASNFGGGGGGLILNTIRYFPPVK